MSTLTDAEILAIGRKHFRPDADETEVTRAAFVAAVRDCIAAGAPNCVHEWDIDSCKKCGVRL
jgi:hypothetical protein